MTASYPLPESDDSGELGRLAARARADERVVLTDHGTPVAAIVSLQDLRDLQATDEADIAEAEAAMTSGEWIPHAEVMKMVGFDDLADAE